MHHTSCHGYVYSSEPLWSVCSLLLKKRETRCSDAAAWAAAFRLQLSRRSEASWLLSFSTSLAIIVSCARASSYWSSSSSLEVTSEVSESEVVTTLAVGVRRRYFALGEGLFGLFLKLSPLRKLPPLLKLDVGLAAAEFE